MVVEFISLLLTTAAYKLNYYKSKYFSNSLTRNKFFNFPELLFLFLKGMTGALAPFSYIVLNNECNMFTGQTTEKSEISKEIFFHEVTKGLTVLIKNSCHFLCSNVNLDNDKAHFILIFHSKLFFPLQCRILE